MDPDTGCTGAAPLSPKRVASANPVNFSVDDLSSLSTVLSRELFEERSLGSIEESLLLRKLERQNKKKFQSGKFRFNIALIGEEGAGKSQIRQRMMEHWTLMSERKLEGFGIEYFYQVSENCNFLQVTILETKPSGKLISHCESRIEEWIQKVKNGPPGSAKLMQEDEDDSRLHLCMWVFPANAGYWRLPPSTLAGVGSDLNMEEDSSVRKRRKESKGGESSDERFLKSGSSLEDLSEAVNLLNREQAEGDPHEVTSHVHSGSGSAAYGHSKKVQEGASLLFSNGRDIYDLQQELLRSRSTNNVKNMPGTSPRGSVSNKSLSKTSQSEEQESVRALEIAAMSSPRLQAEAGINGVQNVDVSTYAGNSTNVTIGTFSDLQCGGNLSGLMQPPGMAGSLRPPPVVGFLTGNPLGTNIYLPTNEGGENDGGVPDSPQQEQMVNQNDLSMSSAVRVDEASGLAEGNLDADHFVDQSGEASPPKEEQQEQAQPSNKDSIFFLSHRMDDEEIELNISDMTASSQDNSPVRRTSNAETESKSTVNNSPSSDQANTSKTSEMPNGGVSFSEDDHKKSKEKFEAEDPEQTPPPLLSAAKSTTRTLPDPREDELLRSPELCLPLMRHLTKLVQLVPVLSKIDMVPPAGVAGLREELRQMLKLGEIQLFQGLHGHDEGTKTIPEGEEKEEEGEETRFVNMDPKILNTENIITEANLNALDTQAVVCKECEESGKVNAGTEINPDLGEQENSNIGNNNTNDQIREPSSSSTAGPKKKEKNLLLVTDNRVVHGNTGGKCVICGRTQIPISSLTVDENNDAPNVENCIEELPPRNRKSCNDPTRSCSTDCAQRSTAPVVDEGAPVVDPHDERYLTSPTATSKDTLQTPPASPILHPDRKRSDRKSAMTPLIRGPDIAPFRLVHADVSCSSDGDPRNSPFYEPLHSGIIEQLRGQVLACPLMVDCNLDFEDQDLRYNLPRFDGLPPTSPDFLRMVLIEGCSLLIIDKACGLFTKYYERRERMLRRRERFETAHQFIMSGLMFAAASAAFFLHRK